MIQSRLVWLVMDKPRHRFVFTTQQHISSSDNNNIRAAHWADHQLKAEWVGNLTRLRTFIPDNGIQLPRNERPNNSLGPAQPPPHWCRMFRLLLAQMGDGLFSVQLVWCRRTNRRPRCPPMLNPSTSSSTA